MATGARTRIDESGISEGATGDESGWTLTDPATDHKAEGMCTCLSVSVLCLCLCAFRYIYICMYVYVYVYM